MKILICGGRDYTDRAAFDAAMLELPYLPSLIIQGGAKGADGLAKQWAAKYNTHCAEVRALWSARGKQAGPDRNHAMLCLEPEYCIAFPGGAGTNDMVRRCEAEGIPVWRPYI